MKMIASRQLAAQPGKVWAELEREGAVVITKDGMPRSIMIPTSDTTLLEDMQELLFSRARRAVRSIRVKASGDRLDRLGTSEIDAEIRATRQAGERTRGHA